MHRLFILSKMLCLISLNITLLHDFPSQFSSKLNHVTKLWETFTNVQQYKTKETIFVV
jgi:hypothetical protein